MDKIAPLFVILGAALWGVDGIVLRPNLYNLPVALVVSIETALAALIMTPFFLKRRADILKLQRGDWLAFAGVAFLGGMIGTMSITKALFYVNFVNLSIVILIQKLQPVFAIALAWIFLKERVPGNFFAWAGLAIAGAYLMTFGLRWPNFETGDQTAEAALLALVAAASFASSTVLGKRALKNVSFEIATYLRFTLTAVIMTLLVISLGDGAAISQINSSQMWIFLLIAFSTGAPAIFLYYYGLKKIKASVATVCELAFPLTAVILEYLLRDNILSGYQWAGVIILFLSILQVTRIK